MVYRIRLVPVLMLSSLLFAAAACSEKDPAGAPEVEPTAGESATAVAIDAEGAEEAGIKIAVAGPAEIRETLTLYGTVKANAEREQSLRARYPGVVKSVAKKPGDTAKKGEVLLSVESSETLRAYDIASPIDGSVLDRNTNPGDAVGSETVLMRVADLSTVWVEFGVFPHDLTRVRAGKVVSVIDSNGVSISESQIAYVSPVGDEDSQSVIARAEVDNADRRWIPGQFVTGEVVVDEVQAPVSVSPGAIQTLASDTVVFVKTASGFEARKVDLGRKSEGAVEIVRGLKGGEPYAAVNSYLIKAELTKGEADED